MYNLISCAHKICCVITGDSKSDAKKAAAEQALKKIYLERLAKLNKAEAEWMVIKEQRQKEREQRHKEWEERQREQWTEDGLDEAIDNAAGITIENWHSYPTSYLTPYNTYLPTYYGRLKYN